MAEWIPFKAKPHERKNNKKTAFIKMCRICGKPTNNGGNICNACRDFINAKKREERREKE